MFTKSDIQSLFWFIKFEQCIFSQKCTWPIVQENAKSSSESIKERFGFSKCPSNVTGGHLTANNFFQISPKAGLRYQVPTDGPRFCAHPRKTSIWQHVNQNDEHAKNYLPDGTLRLMTVDRVCDEKNALADKNNLIAWQMHHRLNNLWCTIISYFQWYVICMNIGNAQIRARLGVRCWGFCSSSSSRRPCPRAGWRTPSPSPSRSPAAACCVRCSPSIWNKQVR